ncbi:unnamed protein product, partial [Porites evermanni]
SFHKGDLFRPYTPASYVPPFRSNSCSPQNDSRHGYPDRPRSNPGTRVSSRGNHDPRRQIYDRNRAPQYDSGGYQGNQSYYNSGGYQGNRSQYNSSNTKGTGHNQTHTLEDLGRVNLSTLAVAINTRHVTLDSSSITIDKDLPTGMIVAIRTRFPVTVTDR